MLLCIHTQTYNVNTQITDSAASGTAYLTGVKTNQGMLGLNAVASRGNCASTKNAEVNSILRWSAEAGAVTVCECVCVSQCVCVY